MGAPVGPVIRVVDPLAIAQNRLEGYLQNHRVKVVGDDDDLQVAEVAALISIAQSLRAFERPKQGPVVAGPLPVLEDEQSPCRCVASQDVGGGRTVDREQCPVHGQGRPRRPL